MTDDLAATLLDLVPDPLAAVRQSALTEAERHERAADVASYARARQIATLVAAMRASYVLVAESGFGYLPLHVAATFGYTGQLDAVEANPAVSAFVEQLARQQSIPDRLRVYLGSAEEVLSSLNGPYDAVLFQTAAQAAAVRFDDIVRLTRTGGAVIIGEGVEEPGEAGEAFLRQLVTDSRLLVSVPPGCAPVLAVRRR